ncbi:MAG: hypothetical protein RML95_03425 [Anaerolineae bacterium]|nr:hypothetical protein [Anaerolineae bacterium]MDW8298367.1 hypothetical protein [Anaerolineae bacterium]
MTPTRNTSQIAIGIAGAMGCYMLILAAASILLGLWIDSLLGNERRIATLVCILVGLPINLISAIWLTLRLIARAIPQTPLKAEASLAESPDKDRAAE